MRVGLDMAIFSGPLLSWDERGAEAENPLGGLAGFALGRRQRGMFETYLRC